jgi:nucleoside-diphosphate-sugar epimerase
MKVYITGATGFVGSNLCKYLANTSCDLKLLNFRNSKWKLEIDLKATALIHLAGKAHDLKKTSNSDEYYQVNTELTKTVFEDPFYYRMYLFYYLVNFYLKNNHLNLFKF